MYWMYGLKTAPAFSALSTSDFHGWRKCNRIERARRAV
jgi:hypothetical protein